MKKVTQRYLPDWVIVGDNSRRVLLQWLLAGAAGLPEEGVLIWIRYGSHLSVSRQNGQWLIETPGILPQTTLCLPPSGSGTAPPFTVSRETRYAVLEGFPFLKQTSLDLVQQLEQQGKEVLVVLLDLPRHQASTDLTVPGEDLAQVYQSYQANHYAVSVLQSAADLPLVLHWRQPLIDRWSKKARGYLRELESRISEIPYDYAWIVEDWGEQNGPLQDQYLDRLFSYQMARRETGPTLWDRFASTACRALFPKSGSGPLAPVADLYRSCLDNPLVFWTVEDDISILMKSLLDQFEAMLTKEQRSGRYRSRTELPPDLDEAAFDSMVALHGDSGTALNAVFRRIIETFLQKDAEICLQKQLEIRYQQLKGMTS